MRIADLDTSRGDDCPSGWTNITTPIAACIPLDSNAGCDSTSFSTFSIPYSKVCGMVMGYQKGTTDGFFTTVKSLNGPYVDGVSITYGSPRKHLWTYAVGLSDNFNSPNYNCPCSHIPGSLPPPFVHDNYYCESGAVLHPKESTYYTDDPVWDGAGCSSDNNCCSEPSLPWFYRQIPLTTNEDIETRICRDVHSSDEDILIKELQLYVQ